MFNLILDTFPTNFSQVATSHGGIFPSGNCPSRIARPHPQYVLAAALCPLDHSIHSARPHGSMRCLTGPLHLTFGKLPLGKLHIWEVASWEIAHLGSCHLGNCTFGKLLLGKLHIWEVAAWEIGHLGIFHLGNCYLGKCLWKST